MSHPYSQFPQSSFWKGAVATRKRTELADLYKPKFPIKKTDRISTYGSCFAQHFSRALIARGYNWVNSETPPHPLSSENCTRFNYGFFSSRTGNIYTTSLFRQWAELSQLNSPLNLKNYVPGNSIKPSRIEYWEKDQRFYDPLRPTIEPNGLETVTELKQCLSHTLNCFRASYKSADIMVFTLGLTEKWINKRSGLEYSICPGTVAGEFDPNIHQFQNMTVEAVQSELLKAIRLMRQSCCSHRRIENVFPFSCGCL